MDRRLYLGGQLRDVSVSMRRVSCSRNGSSGKTTHGNCGGQSSVMAVIAPKNLGAWSRYAVTSSDNLWWASRVRHAKPHSSSASLRCRVNANSRVTDHSRGAICVCALSDLHRHIDSWVTECRFPLDGFLSCVRHHGSSANCQLPGVAPTQLDTITYS
eukprot:scaffold2556_cov425-Prasinococcus_capsulatus_cf.AAC.13